MGSLARAHTWIVVSGAVALLGTGMVLAAGDDEIEVRHKSKIKIVHTDEDGNTHTEVFEHDSQTPRPFLGVALGGASDDGVRVARVIPESAAERAGVREGDLIVSFNGEPIRDRGDLLREVLESEVGDEVDLELRRDGQSRNVTATLGEHEGFRGMLDHDMSFDLDELHEQLEQLGDRLGDLDFDFDLPGHGSLRWHTRQRPKLGVRLVQPTAELREHMGAPADVGVLVGGVVPDTPAAEAGIEVGDLIVGVDGRRVASPHDLVQALRDKDGETVELELVRDGRTVRVDAFLPERNDRPERPSGPRA